MSHHPSSLPITIVTCFHNAGSRVERALERLAEFADACQLVLVDDASTDATAAELRRWAIGREDVVVLALEENRGPAEARNAAIERVERDYVWFIDDDDEPARDALSVLTAAIEESPDIVFARARFRAVDGTERWIDGTATSRVIERGEALESILSGEVHGFLWSKLFRRSVLHSRSFGRDYPQEDFVGLLDAVQRSDRIVLSPGCIYTYVERDGSVSRDRTMDPARYAVASRAAVSAAERAEIDDGLIESFRLWFYVLAVAFVPVRRRGSRVDVETGMRLARNELRTIKLRRVLARRPADALHGWILRVSGPAYPLILRAALLAHDSLRKVLP